MKKTLPANAKTPQLDNAEQLQSGATLNSIDQNAIAILKYFELAYIVYSGMNRY